MRQCASRFWTDGTGATLAGEQGGSVTQASGSTCYDASPYTRLAAFTTAIWLSYSAASVAGPSSKRRPVSDWWFFYKLADCLVTPGSSLADYLVTHTTSLASATEFAALSRSGAID